MTNEVIIRPIHTPTPQGGPGRVLTPLFLERHFLAAARGAPWAGAPERYGAHTAYYNRFVR